MSHIKVTGRIGSLTKEELESFSYRDPIAPISTCDHLRGYYGDLREAEITMSSDRLFTPREPDFIFNYCPKCGKRLETI